ncbi:MAG: ABC transporter permease [Gemmatimonadota bacterium]|nr:ABC transporter permease [Gemmatimonadota bacterium]
MSVFAANDFRQALRKLVRAPGFSAATIFTLALGIGATTAIFSIVDAVILRPLPYDQSNRLVGLWHSAKGIAIEEVQQSDGSYLLYRKNNRAFEEMGIYQNSAITFADAARNIEPQRIPAAYMTASMLPTLRVKPVRGRNFSETEDVAKGPMVALISDRLWRTAFAADRAIVGRTIQINGLSREVIGIMPKDFHFPAVETEIWMPMQMDPAHVNEASFNYNGIARLKPGQTLESAHADVERMLALFPDVYHGALTAAVMKTAQFHAVIHPMTEDVVGDIARVLWILLGTVGVVLLIACANVANLFLVRAESRQKELAVRTALGAGRWEVLRHFLSEAMVLALTGGAVGVTLAAIGVRILKASDAAQIPRLNEVAVDGRVMLFALGVSALAALLFSALPILRYGAPNLSLVLKEGGRASTGGRDRHRARNALVIAQMALALVLLSGSGLMLRSFAKLRAVKPGFEADRVMSFRVSIPTATYKTPQQVVRFFAQATDRLAQIAGVQSVATVRWLPMSGDEGRSNSGTWLEDFPVPEGGVPPVLFNTTAGDGYFKTMGIPLLEGRDFDRADRERPSRGILINKAMADKFWKGRSAIGKRLHEGPTGEYSTIVGVVGDVRNQSLAEAPAPLIYFPMMTLDTSVERSLSFVIRTAGEPTAVMPAVRETMRSLDPSLALYNVQAMRDAVRGSTARTAFTMLLLGIASAIALILGAVGIYGVVSYMVSLRTREIGIRMALGAQTGEVGRMVAREGIALAVIGAVVGLVAAIAVTRSLRALLYDVSPTDPLTLGSVALVLIIVAALASWLPARRAAKVDPLHALRAE